MAAPFMVNFKDVFESMTEFDAEDLSSTTAEDIKNTVEKTTEMFRKMDNEDLIKTGEAMEKVSAKVLALVEAFAQPETVEVNFAVPCVMISGNATIKAPGMQKAAKMGLGLFNKFLKKQHPDDE